MAIKLQATLVEDFSYISLHDDAIDGDADDFAEEFRKYREGTRPMPPLKEGAEPTVWTLKPIASAKLRAALDGVRAEHGQAAWALATAAAGIKGVEGVKGEDGKPLKLQFARQDGFHVLADASLDLIGVAILHEIGMVLLTHNSPS
jgi:hypothetical protein